MLACGLLLGGFCILLGMEWKVAELIGMTLALSSTAIAMQAMNERNLTVSQMGRSTFSVLLFRDIAAIPLVAMIRCWQPAAHQRRWGICLICAEGCRCAGAGNSSGALRNASVAALCGSLWPARSIQRRCVIHGVWFWIAA